ncbi:3-oxoacyl-ACP reductase [Planotetraspora thailandica]|uniref:3-oxoacyl-ACP reductase n=1 Tax=Planotetraspora thailandica TaxID=487172 RepID=A0A8J3V6A3_9ACTN|nr:SDR family oxidoreductase [Planotetraspora thailandica]GII57488.1 3-oxoacyl-ACP reductase [Planotetraspora thailandica]
MTTTTAQRVAIITGGSRGIGRRVAERLAASGLAVVVNYAQAAAAANAVVEDITAAGGTAMAVRADVAKEDEVATLFDTVEEAFGGVDVVVHAASALSRGSVADFDLDQLDHAIRVNLRGTFIVDQQAARRLRPGGALMNFSSSVTRFSNPGNAAYIMTKGGVEALTLLLARELRGRDVTVNAVAPGAIDTDMLQEFLSGREHLRAEIADRSPLERIGTPDDIAEVVLFLAGPARWINGQVLYANGGAI